MLVVDGGGFFPEQDNQQDVAWFLMDAMKVLGTDAVGVGERDLRFGLAYLKSQVKRTNLSVTSANLLDKKTMKPVFAPGVIKQVGSVKVGLFSLINEKATLGMARDSLAIQEPTAAAKLAVADLRKKGATVVVLLSQLGKVESEDLVTAVDGIDAVVVGHDTPIIEKGRMIKNTVACYGGEQGQYVCRTVLTLDDKRHASSGESDAVLLSPEVGERPDMLKLVKSFEDGFNEKLRKQEQERAAKATPAKTPENSPDHFIGGELCIRCHAQEGEQWKTTAHSVAWSTLVEVKKDATPDCIPCHVVGYNQPGGFVSGTASLQLGNVQCENCHGMGTQHDAFATPTHRITAQTCITCHHGENDPEFNWEKKLPMIAHGNMSGETLKNRKLKRDQASPMMKGGVAH